MKLGKKTSVKTAVVKRKRTKMPVLFGIAVFTFVAIILFNVISMQVGIAQKSSELAQAQTQYDALKVYNDELTQLLNSAQDEESIIRMAREKLNLVFPDERVYCDIAG